MDEITRDLNRDFEDWENNDKGPEVDFCTVCLLDLDECICNRPTPDQTFIRYNEPPTPQDGGPF